MPATPGTRPPARRADGERSGRPCTAQGITAPVILRVLDQDPRDLGYRATVGTAPLVQQDLSASHQKEGSLSSVRRAVARLRWCWKRPRYTLSRRSFCSPSA
jgi:hypothetical protein